MDREKQREHAYRPIAENEFGSGCITCPFNLINKQAEAMRGRGECSVSGPAVPSLPFQPAPLFTN